MGDSQGYRGKKIHGEFEGDPRVILFRWDNMAPFKADNLMEVPH